MIKVGDMRYNPDDIWTYCPDYYLEKPCILIERKHIDREEKIVFETKEERDKTLEAMDELFLLIDEGKIIRRDDILPPIVFGSGGDDMGGINLQ